MIRFLRKPWVATNKTKPTRVLPRYVSRESSPDPPLLRFYTPGPVDPNVSRIMSRNRGRDTGPEIGLRRALWKLGVRYRCHPTEVPGRPDVRSEEHTSELQSRLHLV